MVNRGEPSVTSLVVDDRGLRFSANGDFPVDVHFADKRIFSFWTERDTTSEQRQRFFPWPPVLNKFLDGTVDLSVVDPVSGAVLTREQVSLGSGQGEIVVQDAHGQPMGLDKSMRLIGLFVDQGETQKELLLDSLDTVITALQDAGIQPFVAYGTLLGAVRQGDFIGHDSDADLGYVSAFEDPADVVRESFMLQRRIRAMGYSVFRYSGLGFKISVRGADGSIRGLDVFGGFMREGHLYLMGEVGAPFKREWIDPLSEVTLAGRTYPAPAQPEHLLEAMYGPNWKVPDPAYKFTTPSSTSRRLSGWFRGVRAGLDDRWLHHSHGRTEAMLEERSSLAEHVLSSTDPDTLVVDLGSGRGVDAVWLAQQGRRVIGLDYFDPDLRRARRRAGAAPEPITGAEPVVEDASALTPEAGTPVTGNVEFWWANFGDYRSVMATGAALVRRPGPRVLMGHHLLDSLASRGQDNVFRLARMVARKDGVLHLQHYVTDTEHSAARDLKRVRHRAWRQAMRASGGRVLERELITEHQAGVPGADPQAEPTIERVTVTWSE